MNAKSDNDIIHVLDGLDQMNTDAARAIRDSNEFETATYQDSHDDNATIVSVVRCGSGSVILTDRYDAPDIAWSGDLDAPELIDELVARDELISVE